MENQMQLFFLILSMILPGRKEYGIVISNVSLPRSHASSNLQVDCPDWSGFLANCPNWNHGIDVRNLVVDADQLPGWTLLLDSRQVPLKGFVDLGSPTVENESFHFVIRHWGNSCINTEVNLMLTGTGNLVRELPVINGQVTDQPYTYTPSGSGHISIDCQLLDSHPATLLSSSIHFYVKTLYTLSTSLATGTTGAPSAETIYPEQTIVPYDYSLSAAYNSLAVFIDGLRVPVTGSITMDSNHSIEVTADLTAGTISSGRLHITMETTSDGAKVASIKNDGFEILNTTTLPPLFTLLLESTSSGLEEMLTSCCGWDSVILTNDGDHLTIAWSNPNQGDLPATLTATMTIHTADTQSQWDLEVSGLGTYSLMNVHFPQLNIRAEGEDHFLLPYYSGKVISNPGSEIDFFDDPSDSNDDRTGLYPRGWGTTMQFLSYYNTAYGLYFGFHDPDAAIKQFGVKDQHDGVYIECRIPAENKTVADNSWSMPGHVEIDLFEGDWYDASLIYRTWVSNEASYWPRKDSAREARQSVIGNIGVWAYHYLSDGDLNLARLVIQEFSDFMDVPVGIHWYEWNYLDMDDDYPNYFPELEGVGNLVSDVQEPGSIEIMPYINGRMYDTDLPTYNTQGYPEATKHETGDIYWQNFNSNHFAVMCPTQTTWRDTLTDASNQLTSRIGTAGVYIDQVCAASPVECMDATHNHALGGGSWWRAGYNSMFENIHDTIPLNRFITVEGGCDFLADEVDGFMVQGWTTNGLVPAFPVVYSGRIQLFGNQTGTSHYGDQQFYGKLAQGFSFGIQTGRQSIWITSNLANASEEKLMAAGFVKRLGKMRHRLKDFISFGTMKRSLPLSGSIPELTYTVKDFGNSVLVTLPAITSSLWQNEDGMVAVFTNATMPTPPNTQGEEISFSFSFDSSNYGINEPISIRVITDTDEGEFTPVSNMFTRNVALNSLAIVAFMVVPTASLPQQKTNYTD
jgi:hypothetical protein